MKSIGVIGTGHRSTLWALERLNLHYQHLTSEEHNCPIHLIQPDFYEINAILPDGISEAASLLEPIVEAFSFASTSCIILLNNTMHKALDVVVDKGITNIPILHLGDLLARQLSESSTKKVVVLGTKHTMNAGYIQSFIPDSIKTVDLPSHLQNLVDDLRKTYFFGEDEELAVECFNQLKDFIDEETTVLLACTELSLAFEKYHQEIKQIDTLDILCKGAVDFHCQQH